MHQQKKIVGICGRKGSGKSLLGQELIRRDYPRARLVPFAKALKEGLVAMGVPSACLYLPEQKEVPQARLGGHTGRYAMQTLGTEWGRDLMGPNFWIEMWHSHVEATGNEVVIVDDIRFEEELQAVLEYKNAVVVGLTRPGLPPLPPRWKFWEKVHRSERFEPQAFGLPTLVNDSTPEALYQRFNQLLSIR